jgi:hypothetical protein
MSKLSFQNKIYLYAVLIFSIIFGGCAVKAAKNETVNQANNSDIYSVKVENKTSETNGKITITENSPADAIRTFYKNLRENRFREAIFLTNLRPTVEGLTDAELKDLQIDFSKLAAIIPGEIEVSGEIITNDKATVMAKLPDNAAGKTELKEFKLEKQNGGWLILMVDSRQEAEIKKQGKNYFFALRIEVHHAEVEKMMDRIYKAQLVHSLQNGGEFTGFTALIEKNLLPEDVQSPDSTGYKYNLSLSSDKKQYTVTAEPAAYGKTGKFSYLLNAESGKKPVLKQEDKQGKSLKS